ncbi:hypothetical protein CHL78_013765 [Romboutsia weinsteinii]|uniref:Antibiotic biosynthesis monooxygenase n=1 Tax=Romboutsia weinsteinii TaxID=2020949 RepID=A0A255I445_9FIRM|nr:hypothetical protein [Romboutsia weinsteinii]RDY26398.1 hypothetical protein CHL78_013765 [Romboutsia weinsteinii]
MCADNVFYNVNKIVVVQGFECSYIDFSRELNEYLLRNYPGYYLGLQLYQDNCNCNLFHVVATYNNICGVYEAARFIGNDINSIYERIWGECVDRTSVFSFLTSTRVVC